MQDFEGPLDLILYLLGRNKMEIQDISIALICDQYLAWLSRRQELDLEVASEFVTMASQLVYIKTRMLLSIEDEEVQSEMDALIASLEERRRNESYARVRTMAARLEPLGEFGRNILTRPPEPVERGKIYEYDQEPADLILAMAEIQSRAERSLPPPRSAFQDIVRHEPYPVENKARRSCASSGTTASPGFCCCSGAAAPAVRWWPPSWRCWSCAGPTSCIWRGPSRTAPSGRSGRCPTI